MTPIQGLLLAIGVEAAVVLPVALMARRRSALGTWLLLVAGANLVTYFPFLATVTALRPRWGGTASLVALEALVSLGEGAIYAAVGGLGWRRGLVLGAAANAASYGAGGLLWPSP